MMARSGESSTSRGCVNGEKRKMTKEDNSGKNEKRVRIERLSETKLPAVEFTSEAVTSRHQSEPVKLNVHDESVTLGSPKEDGWLLSTETHLAALKEPIDSRTCYKMSTLCVADDVSLMFNLAFMDEDEVFNMPALVNYMAEGLIIAPPLMTTVSIDWDNYDDNDDYTYIKLWSD